MMRAVIRHPVRFHGDHRFARAHASAYLDDELDQLERERIDSHAHLCPPCARFMAGLRRTVAALGGLREPELTDVGDGVLARLREERR